MPAIATTHPHRPWSLAARFAGALALLAVGLVHLQQYLEPGYDPTAIAVSRAAEAATVVLLGFYLIASLRLKTSTGRW